MKAARATGVVLSAILWALPVAAETAKAGTRDGFVFGFGVGFGATYPCDSCPSFAGSVYVGAMTARNVAVVADVSLMGGDVDRDPSQVRSPRGLGLATFTLGVQFWPHERFWLKTGVGIGVPFDSEWDDWDEDFDKHYDNHYDRSWAGIVGAGYEVTRKGQFVLDLQARGAFASGQQGVSLGLGFNW
jgi:hypothetical protein